LSKQQNGSQSYESESAMVRVAGCWKLESGTRFQVQLIRAPVNVKSAIRLARARNHHHESAMARVASCWKLKVGTRFQVQLIKAPANVKSAITLVRARNERRYNERAMARVAKRWK
jgi:hypothetical protein